MRKFKKIRNCFIALTLVATLAFPVFAGDNVVMVGGGQATKPLSEFVTNSSVIGEGDVWYVDSNQATAASGDGKSWDYAVLTIDEAINLATASNGDVIYVAAHHAETISAADGFDADKAGLSIIGFGKGSAAPTLTFSATASEVVYGAAGIYTENLRFIAGISSIVMGISIEAAGDDLVFNKCVFPKPTTNSWEFLDAIDIATGANNIRFENCEYYNDEGGAAPAHFIDAGNGTAGPERLQVVNCIIKGDFSVAAIWSDEPCDEAYIAGNTITNHTTGQHCVEFSDSGTGAIVNNKLYGDTEGAILDPGSMYIHGNTLSTAIDLEGKPRWVIDEKIDHLTDVSEPSYNHANYIALSVDLTSATWNTQAAHEILTVTGAIKLRVLVECTEALTGAGATIELGTANNTAEIIAQTTGTDIDATEIWKDATPDVETVVGANTGIREAIVVGGTDVGYTVGTAALTDGTLIFHIWWTALDATGAAVVGAGGAL